MDLEDAISELDLYGILANFDSSQAGYYAIKPNQTNFEEIFLVVVLFLFFDKL